MYVLKFIKAAGTRKTGIIWVVILSSCLLVACNSGSKVKATFTGTIDTVNEDGHMSVNIEEVTDTKLGGVIDVVIPDDTMEKFNAGDKIKIGFDGITFESAPVQVRAITVEKVD